MAADSISNRRGKKQKHNEHRQNNPQGDDAGPEQSPGKAPEQQSNFVTQGVDEFRDRLRKSTLGHEGTAVLVALAVGFGAGIAIGTTLAPPQRRSRRWYDRSAAEGIGQRVLDRLADMLPDSLAECLGR